MHFKDDPISDIHAKNYLIISCLKHFPGPTKFGPVFWSRLFRRGPVEYNYPISACAVSGVKVLCSANSKQQLQFNLFEMSEKFVH